MRGCTTARDASASRAVVVEGRGHEQALASAPASTGADRRDHAPAFDRARRAHDKPERRLMIRWDGAGDGRRGLPEFRTRCTFLPLAPVAKEDIVG
jgi:hypothetical protein